MTTIVIARLTFQEARRSKILLVGIILTSLFLGVFGLGFYLIRQEMVDQASRIGRPDLLEMNEIFSFLLMSGFYVVNFMAVMMSVLTSVGTLSGEIYSGTIHTLVSKPVRRWEIVFGKWVGYIVLLTLYLLILAGGVLVLVYIISGYSPPNMVRGLVYLWINMALMLSVSILGGARLSTLTNGVLVFGLFGISFVGGWIEQIGSFIDNQTAVNVGILSSLLMPSEALWKRLAFELQSPLVSALGGFSPFSASSVPSPVMIFYAVFYMLVALFLAMRIFQTRDL
jgi:ABC-type transport system involved in multi-copper enzyme maturation permease subunit